MFADRKRVFHKTRSKNNINIKSISMVATIMIINTMIRMCILIEEGIILDDLIINVKTFIHIKVVEGGGGEEEEEDLTTIIISTLLNNRLNRRKDHITIRIILIGTTRITQHRIRQVENMINHLHHINRGITRLISNLKNMLVITVTGHIKPPGNCVRLCVHDNHPSCYL